MADGGRGMGDDGGRQGRQKRRGWLESGRNAYPEIQERETPLPAQLASSCIC